MMYVENNTVKEVCRRKRQENLKHCNTETKRQEKEMVSSIVVREKKEHSALIHLLPTLAIAKLLVCIVMTINTKANDKPANGPSADS